MSPLEELHSKAQDLHDIIDAYETEIDYLEELLSVTSGPADQTIEDLQRNRTRRDELRSEYSEVLKMIEELKNGN